MTRLTHPKTQDAKSESQVQSLLTSSPTLRSRMELPVNVPQPAPRHMRIDLRRADVRVAEQFLDDAQIRAMLQEMRRKTVPQHVRRDIPDRPRPANPILDSQP